MKERRVHHFKDLQEADEFRGVKYRPIAASVLLRDNVWIYGVGGIIVPFIGIKMIDIVITHVGLA